MTTIAVVPGPRGRIVADTLVSGDGPSIRLKRQSKLRHWAGSSVVFGLAGQAADVQNLARLPAPEALGEMQLAAWASLAEARLPGLWERSSVLVACLDTGEAAEIDSGFVTLIDGPYAIGSGAAYALGAMAAGAGPEQAVRIAARHDPMTCGRRLHLFRFGQ